MARRLAGSQRAKNPSSASMRSTAVVARADECSCRSKAGPAASNRATTSCRMRWRAAVPLPVARRSDITPRAARTSAARPKPANTHSGATAARARAMPRMVAAHPACASASSVVTRPNATTGRDACRPSVVWRRSQSRPPGVGKLIPAM